MIEPETDDVARAIWRWPTMVYARVPATAAVGLGLTLVALLIAVGAPDDRLREPVGRLRVPPALEHELAELADEHEQAQQQLDDGEAALVEIDDDAERDARISRNQELEARITTIDERALVAAELAGLRCRPDDDLPKADGPLPVVCRGPTLENAAGPAWLGFLALVSVIGLMVFSGSLVSRRRLLPWGAPRARLLPAILTSVTALVAPLVVMPVVFFGRDADYPIPLEGGPVHVGSALAVALGIVSVALLLHVLVTASDEAIAAVLGSVAVVGLVALITTIAWGPGVAAIGLVPLGALLCAFGSLVGRRLPLARGAIVIGVLVLAGGGALAALWARPGGWCWGLVGGLVALLVAPVGPQEQALREMLPRTSGAAFED